MDEYPSRDKGVGAVRVARRYRKSDQGVTGPVTLAAARRFTRTSSRRPSRTGSCLRCFMPPASGHPTPGTTTTASKGGRTRARMSTASAARSGTLSPRHPSHASASRNRRMGCSGHVGVAEGGGTMLTRWVPPARAEISKAMVFCRLGEGPMTMPGATLASSAGAETWRLFRRAMERGRAGHSLAVHRPQVVGIRGRAVLAEGRGLCATGPRRTKNSLWRSRRSRNWHPRSSWRSSRWWWMPSAGREWKDHNRTQSLRTLASLSSGVTHRSRACGQGSFADVVSCFVCFFSRWVSFPLALDVSSGEPEQVGVREAGWASVSPKACSILAMRATDVRFLSDSRSRFAVASWSAMVEHVFWCSKAWACSMMLPPFAADAALARHGLSRNWDQAATKARGRGPRWRRELAVGAELLHLSRVR